MSALGAEVVSDRVTYECGDCGSRKIGFDAFAGWDADRQEFFLRDVNTDEVPPICISCQGWEINKVPVEEG